MLQSTFNTPYYAVIFSSVLTGEKLDVYQSLNNQLVADIKVIEGYLGHDSVRKEEGITVAYFRSKEAINEWRHHSLHKEAKKLGVADFYSEYHIKICLVEYETSFYK